MRFIDHIRKEEKEYLDTDGIAEIYDVPVIVADNVAQYFFEDNDKEYWTANDFPNIAPPFPAFWIETKAPKLIHSKEKGDTQWAKHGSRMWGLMCVGRTYAQNENLLSDEYGQTFFLRALDTLLNSLMESVFSTKDLNAVLERTFHQLEETGEEEATEEIALPLSDKKGQRIELLQRIQEHAKREEWSEVTRLVPDIQRNRFSLEMWLYVRMPYWNDPQKDINMGPVWYYRFDLNERGEILHFPGNDKEAIGIEITMPHGKAWVEMIATALDMPVMEASQQIREHLLPFSQVALMTLSFLHCKNVELEETKPAYQPVYNKQAKKRGEKGFQPTVFKTLNIYPMSPSQGSESKHTNSGGVSGKRMHIARGHFRDYQEGKGLFGKYHGLFWVPQHIRGTKESGTIAKDYKLSTKHVESFDKNALFVASAEKIGEENER